MYTVQVEITNDIFECSKTVPIALYHCLFQSTKTNPTSKKVFRLCSYYAAGSREIALVPTRKPKRIEILFTFMQYSVNTSGAKLVGMKSYEI